MANSLVRQQPSFASYIKNEAVMKSISTTLGDTTKSQKFVASIISAVSTNSSLQECNSNSIISSALLGESLNLSPSPQLGHYYLVPFNNKDTGKVATFQLGYKGMIQLAIRSGQYKTINVLPIKKGELISYDPLTEEIKVELIDDEDEREKAETIGYYAMFELVNGFRKSIFWTKKKMENHALKYSSGYKSKKGYTFWEKSFDDMACKTMLRQLISKWGIMSIELQTAYEKDMTYQDSNGNDVYFDTLPIQEEKVADVVEVVEESNENKLF